MSLLETTIRRNQRLNKAWRYRKQMCEYYSIAMEKKDDRIEDLEMKLEHMQRMVARYEAEHCER